MHGKLRAIDVVPFTAGAWASLAMAGDVTSTRQVAFPTEWSTVNRWDHDVPGVGTFPNNGNEGHTFDVIFPGNTVDLDLPVTIDNLQINGTLRLGGNVLTVLQSIDSTFGYFQNGTLDAINMSATSTVTLQDANASTDFLFLNNNATAVVQGDSNFEVREEVSFAGDGDLIAIEEASGLGFFELTDTFITKTGGNSASDITAPIDAQTLTMRNDADCTALRFQQYPVNIDTLNVDHVAAGATIDFSAPLTVNDINMTSTSTGVLLLKGPVQLQGTISSDLDARGSITLSANFGSGSISGGTIDCASRCPFIIDGNASVGDNGKVTTGQVSTTRWKSGTVRGGGLENKSDLYIEGSTGTRLVTGTTLKNTLAVHHNGVLTLGQDGRVESSFQWFMASDIVPQSASIVESTAFSFGTGTITGGEETFGDPEATSANVHVPFRIGAGFQPSIDVRNSTITLHHAVDLQRVRVAGTTGTLILTPNPPMGVQLELGDVEIERAATTGPGNFVLLSVQNGDYTITDRIHAGESNDAGVASVTGGSISGGEINMAAGAFTQSGGQVGKSSGVANKGNYNLVEGLVGPSLVTNEGTVSVTGLSAPPVLENFSNLAAGLVECYKTVEVSLPGARNFGVWDCLAVSPFEIRPSGGGPGLFTNFGTLSFSGSSTEVEFSADIDTPGTIKADGGTVDFTGGVEQYLAASRTLTGGTFHTLNGGRILFSGANFAGIENVGPNAEVILSDTDGAGTGPYSDMEMLQGKLRLSGSTDLSVTGNGSNGIFFIDETGCIDDGDLILRGTTGPTFTASRVTVKGIANFYDNSNVNALVGLNIIDGGVLNGQNNMLLTPLVDNISGIVSPGHFDTGSVVRDDCLALGTLNITGDYSQGVGAVLEIEVAGGGACDALSVSGHVTLGGTLMITSCGNAAPGPMDSFEIMTAASITGAFDLIIAPPEALVDVQLDRIVVTFNACPGDFNDDLVVDFGDLNTVLNGFGTLYDFNDLNEVLAEWSADCGDSGS